MPSIYDAIEVKGTMRYRRDKRFIGKDKVPSEVLEAITLQNMVDENGTVIVDDKGAELAQVSPEDQAALDKENTNSSDKSDLEEDPETPKAPASPTDATPASVDDGEIPTDPEHETAISDVIPGPTNVPLEDQEGYKPAQKATAKKKAQEPRFVSKVPQSKPGMGFPRKNGKTVDIFDQETPHTHIKLVGGYTVPLSTDSFNTRTEKEIEDRLIEMGYELIDFNRGETPVGAGLTDDDGDGLTDERP